MKGLALVLVLLPLAASAATITVDSAADSQFPFDGQCTLREAIDNVNVAADTTGGDCAAGTGSGDTIAFDLPLPATIVLSLDGVLEIDADVTINGPTTGLLVVDGNGQVGVLHITAGTVRMANLIIQNGRSAQGGGIYNNGTLALTNCTLSGNGAGEGGGIYNDSDGTATLADCTLGGNAAVAADDHEYWFDRQLGGGVYNRGILAATRCTLTGNTAIDYGDGGGVYNDGTVTLTDTALSGNASVGDGGGMFNDIHGTGTLTKCMLFANSANDGAGVYSDGTLTLTGCTLSANTVYSSGGGVYNDVHGALTLADGTLIGNYAGTDGGAVDNNGEATLSNCTLSFNAVEYGNGGAVTNDGTMTLTDCTLFGNRANNRGGGLHNGGGVTLTNCTLSSNTLGSGAQEGGAGMANVGGTAILTNCTLSDNSVRGGPGGGISNSYAGTLILNNCTVSGNSSGDGGGISNSEGIAILTNCTLIGNSAGSDYSYGGDGGGILNAGERDSGLLIVIGCTLSGNSASQGGGIANYRRAVLTNSTLSGNSAEGDSDGGGGGIYNRYGTVNLTNCTVSGNSALLSQGQNLNNLNGDEYGSTTLANTIVANGISGDNCAGDPVAVITDGGHNLDSDGTCGVGPATDPGLDPRGLADNGGPTQTIALQPGSPAINAGDKAICAAPPVDNVDQRGVVRLAAGSINCSIGAYEYEPVPPITPTASPTNTPTPTAIGASTITVNSTTDDITEGDGQCTLREAIANVNAHADISGGDCAAGIGAADTIVFGFSLPAKITLTATLEISSDVTINGPGEGLLALDGNGKVRVIDITTGTVSISNVTIENGTGGDYPALSGGVRNTGTLTLSNCTLSGNRGGDGGGVYNDGTLTMVSCTLRNNIGGGGGGSGGGGIYNDVDGTALLSNCTLENNSGDAGGIYNSGAMTVANCALDANAGGGVNNDGGTLTMTDCTLSGNIRFQDGGGVNNSGTLTMTNCVLNGNKAAGYYGGGGGAIYNDDEGEATLTNCTLSFNSAHDGGGVHNRGTMTLTDCTLFGNVAGGNPFNGGGVYNSGTVNLTNCTLNSNSAADGSGGGVYNTCDYSDVCPTAILTNCTLTGNSAGGGYQGRGGGGISNTRGGTVTLTNCTLSGNSAANGPGGNLAGPPRDYGCYADDGAITLANTIIANSIGGGNCAGCAIADAGHNLDSDGTCGAGPLTDPRLDPAGPANNGGPTLTIALLADSPAINAGDESICASPDVNDLDQRGSARPGPDATNCSIGAYEYDLPLPTPTVTPTPGPVPTCATAGEGTYLVLTCPTGIIIAIDFASYGTPQGSCGSFRRGSCHAASSVASVGSACVGKPHCELAVDNGTFRADPCPGAAKTLAVQARCSLPVPTRTVTPTDTPAPTATPLPTASPTPTVTPPSCAGDCNGDQHVDGAELLRMVDVALGNQAADGCAVGDVAGIVIADVITAVIHALSGCPGA